MLSTYNATALNILVPAETFIATLILTIRAQFASQVSVACELTVTRTWSALITVLKVTGIALITHIDLPARFAAEVYAIGTTGVAFARFTFHNVLRHSEQLIAICAFKTVVALLIA